MCCKVPMIASMVGYSNDSEIGSVRVGDEGAGAAGADQRDLSDGDDTGNGVQVRADDNVDPLAKGAFRCGGGDSEARNAEKSNDCCLVSWLPSVEPPNCSGPATLMLTPVFVLGFGRARFGRWSRVIKSGGLYSSQLVGSRV